MTQEKKVHKAGFVSIIGKPNVGKSTLMNKLVGERLSIITYKAQTTRHRIMGILSGDDFQIVYSDTPGIIQPKYELHKSMMQYVRTSLEDADIILWVIDIQEKFEEEEVLEMLQHLDGKILLLINKIDISEQNLILEKVAYWQEKLPDAEEIIPISALEGFNVEAVFDSILKYLPEHPAYFPKDELTNRSERFFASEIIREQIFLNYGQEIPYACQVEITDFRQDPKILHIRAQILVEKDSQKGIIIGKGGKALKKVGTEARKILEDFFEQKIFLQQHVKVEKNWRKESQKLKRMGYNQ